MIFKNPNGDTEYFNSNKEIKAIKKASGDVVFYKNGHKKCIKKANGDKLHFAKGVYLGQERN